MYIYMFSNVRLWVTSLSWPEGGITLQLYI